jgi:hypothetical protein
VCPPSLRRWRDTDGGEEGVREGARPLKATGNALRCFRWLRRAKMSLGIAEEVDSFSDVRDIFKTGMVVCLWCRVVFIAGLYYYNEWLCLEVIVVWPSRDSPEKHGPGPNAENWPQIIFVRYGVSH